MNDFASIKQRIESSRLRDIVEQFDVGRDIATKLGIYIDIQSLDIDMDQYN